LIFEYINEYEIRKFKFIDDRECIIIPIYGEEYKACENPDMWCTRDDTPSTKGLANSMNEPSIVERAGRIGECASSKLFGVEVNFERIKGGDNGIDFRWKGKTFDIKTARNYNGARRHKKNFIKATDKNGYRTPLHSDIYISSFILDEDKEAKEASVVMVGWMTKKRLKHLHKDGLHVSPRWSWQLNYELKFKDTNPIVPLVERVRSFDRK